MSVLVLLVLSLLYGFRPVRADRASSPSIDESHASHTRTESTPRAEPHAAIRSSPSSRPTAAHRLHVFDQAGLPLSQATVWQLEPSARPREAIPRPASTKRALLGRTDEHGEFRDFAKIPALPKRVYVSHAGHVDAALDVSCNAKRCTDTHRVTLLRAHRLLFEVEDVRGRPVAHVPILVSQAASLDLPDDSRRIERMSRPLPGRARSARRFKAVTDAHGRAVFSPVPEGTYAVRVKDATRVVVSDLYRKRILVPCQPIRITLGEIYGAVVRVIGDTPDICEAALPTIPRAIQVLQPRLATEHEKLRQRFPLARVFVTAPSASTQQGPAPVIAPLYVFARHSGWSEHAVELRPVREIEEPSRIVLKSAWRGEQSARLIPDIRWGDGSQCKPGFLKLYKMNPENLIQRMPVTLRTGQELRLPPGEYRIRSQGVFFSTKRVRKALARKITLSAGQVEQVTIVLPRTLVAVRIRARGAEGVPIRYANVAVIPRPAARKSWKLAMDLPNRPLWLPPDTPTRVYLDAFGYRRKELDVLPSSLAKPERGRDRILETTLEPRG